MDSEEEAVQKRNFLQRVIHFNPYPHLGTYIYIPKIMYDWAAILLATPVRLSYNEDRKAFVVTKCNNLQRILCILVQLCFTCSAMHTMYEKGLDLIRNTAYIVAYFDFMNVFVLNVYIYSHLYIHWFRLDLMEAYVDIIQTSPILKCCRTPMWKAVLVSAFICSVATYISCIWFLVVFQIDFSNSNAFLASVKVNARELFWYDRNADVSPPLFLSAVACIGRLYNAYFIHVPLNAFLHINLYCAYFIAKDYFGAVLKHQMAPTEALYLLEEYKKLMKILNEYLTQYVLHFTAMTMTFHSVHLFDVLNTQVFIWKINMYIYLGYLVNFFLLPPTQLIRTRKIKKWLWMNHNCMKISKQELQSVLYDVLDFQFGIKAGRFYIISADFSGLIVGNMISYSMLNMLTAQ